MLPGIRHYAERIRTTVQRGRGGRARKRYKQRLLGQRTDVAVILGAPVDCPPKMDKGTKTSPETLTTSKNE